MLIDADHRVFPAVDAVLQPEGLLVDLGLQEPRLERADGPALPLDAGHVGADLLFELVGQGLDQVRAAEGVGRPGHPRLQGQDLLGPEPQVGGLLAGDTQRLVERRGGQGLDAAQDRGQGLVRDPDEVVERLVGRLVAAQRVAEDVEGPAGVVGGPEALGHDVGPHTAGRPELGHLLEDVEPRGQEHVHRVGERLEAQSAVEGALDVLDAVADGNGHLLHRGRAGVPDVVAAELDRLPVGEGTWRSTRSRRRKSRVRPGRGKMWVWRATYSFRTSFCSITLKSAGEYPWTSAPATNSATASGPIELAVVRIWATLSRGHAVEQLDHVGQAVDGHAHPSHLAMGQGVIGVQAQLGGEVQRHREPGLAAERNDRIRWLVSVGDPCPEYIPMTQWPSRYMPGRIPRVNGGCPGRPSLLS